MAITSKPHIFSLTEGGLKLFFDYEASSGMPALPLKLFGHIACLGNQVGAF